MKLLDSSSKLTFLELPKDDPKRRRPDLTKIQSVSDYEPKVSFEDGMRQTAEYFKSLF